MSRARIWGVVGIAVALFGAWYTWEVSGARPIEALRKELSSLDAQKDGLRREIGGLNGLAGELDGLAARTLGRDAESVVARLRTILTTIATEGGLVELKIDSRVRGGEGNPAARERVDELRSVARSAVDFGVAEASLTGSGAIGDVYSALLRLDEQPWFKRVRSLRIDPSSDGQRATLAVSIETLYFPERSPEAAPAVVALSDAGRARARGVTDLGLFTPYTPPPAPKPEVVVEAPKPVEPPKPEAPRPPPYGDWVVTGVWESSEGVQMLVRHRRNNSTRTISGGDSLMGISPRRIVGVDVVVAIEGVDHLIRVGEDLGTRRRIDDPSVH